MNQENPYKNYRQLGKITPYLKNYLINISISALLQARND
jgi:hypothetical protein